MGDAPGAPRSPAELAACAAGIDTLAAAGLLQPDEAEKRRDALRAEALSWVRGLEVRRGSVGEGTSVTRLQPSVGSGALSLAAPQPSPSVAKRKRPEVEHPEFVQTAVKRLHTAAMSGQRTRGTLAPVGCQSILSMPGFTRTVEHGGEALSVVPVLRFFKRLRCCFRDSGCEFSSDLRGPLTMHETRGCKFRLDTGAAGTVKGAPANGGESDGGDDDGSTDDDTPCPRGAGAAAGHGRDQTAEPKQDGRRTNRGSKRRKHMSDTEKADALDLLAETLERGGLVQDAESALGLSSGMLSTWRKNSEKIYSLAAEKLRKTLSRAALAKAAKQARYPAMETKLVADIKRYRARGRHLSIRWLTTKARALFAELYPDATEPFLASRSWRRRFMHRHRLTRLKVTNTKSKSVEDRLPVARDFHQKLALLVSNPPPRAPDAPMDAVHGRFLLHDRFNVDQVKLNFTSATDRTIDFVGAERPRSNVPAEGLLKRCGTVNLCFPPVLLDRKAMGPIGLILPGAGRLPSAELAAYDKRVCVSFQRKAWQDRPTALKWLEEVWKPIAASTPGEKLLFCDNLDAHVFEGFRKTARELNTLVWFFPPNCTDFLQPVDAGAGAVIGMLYLRAQDRWLDKDANLELWESKMTASQRRVLVTQWLGAAWEAFLSPDYDEARLRYFQKTGCAMTADGSADLKITPEGTKNYKFERLSPGEASAAALEELLPEIAPEPDSDDDDDVDVQLGGAQDASDDDELAPAPEGFAFDKDDPEEELMTFAEMVRLLLKPDEQLRVLPGPPPLDSTLVGRHVAVRVVDVGWCAGLVVGQSSGPNVKGYNFKVRFDADDEDKLWLRESNYVGSSTFSASNNWAELAECPAGAWTLFALSIAPRGTPASVARAGGGGSGFQLTDAAKAEAARRAARLQPVPVAPRPAAALKQSRTLPLTATSEPKPELPDLRDFTEAEAQRFLEQRKLIGRRVHYDDTPGVIVDVEPSLDYGFLYDVKYDDKTWGQIELSEIKDALAAANTVPSAADRPAPLAAVAARRGPAAAPVAPRQQTLLSWRPSPPT